MRLAGRGVERATQPRGLPRAQIMKGIGRSRRDEMSGVARFLHPSFINDRDADHHGAIIF